MILPLVAGLLLVLAALASRSYRFDEFVRAASWKADALVPWWTGADGEGALSDIVQRMLGDGYFNYDIVSYTGVPLPVRPAPLAMQDTTAPPPSPYPLYSTCLDCTFVGFQEIVLAPFGVCDPFLVPCLDNRFSRRHRFPDSGIRSVDVPMNVMALSLGPARSGSSAGIVVAPRNAPLLFNPRAGPTLPPVEVRARVPVQATPLGPGYVTVGVRPARARPARAAFQEVRLTLSPSAPSEAPQSPAQGGGTALVQVSRQAAPPAAGRLVAAAALPRSRVLVAATAQAPPAAPPRSRAVASGGGVTAGEMHGVALPGATHAMRLAPPGGGPSPPGGASRATPARRSGTARPCRCRWWAAAARAPAGPGGGCRPSGSPRRRAPPTGPTARPAPPSRRCGLRSSTRAP